eukprot:79615-Chlamydomonas_euryale.AAC.3
MQRAPAASCAGPPRRRPRPPHPGAHTASVHCHPCVEDAPPRRPQSDVSTARADACRTVCEPHLRSRRGRARAVGAEGEAFVSTLVRPCSWRSEWKPEHSRTPVPFVTCKLVVQAQPSDVGATSSPSDCAQLPRVKEGK